MKTSTFINCIFLTVAYCVGANAQQCSPQALAAKYWQYRNNFSSHFIAIDRSTNGCINDGIGQDINDPCICKQVTVCRQPALILIIMGQLPLKIGSQIQMKAKIFLMYYVEMLMILMELMMTYHGMRLINTTIG